MSVAVVNVLRSSSPLPAERNDEVCAVAKNIFGHEPLRFGFPGGSDRSAFLVDMGDQVYVFAKRGERGNARTEFKVLRTLEASGHTPRLKALAGDWIIQEYIEGVRLAVLLDMTTGRTQRENYVGLCLEGLSKIYEYARGQNLTSQLPVIGKDRDWFHNRLGAAERTSETIGIKAPDIDLDYLSDALFGQRDEFIKYDARPGNVLLADDHAYWIDWEDCGAGKMLEDLAFVLCDEWTALDGVSEDRLIERFLPQFQGQYSTDEAHRILTIYGVMHTIIRLRMALKHKLSDGTWWNRDTCLSKDKVGNTPEETARLCDRAKRWSQKLPELNGYGNWLEEVKARFQIPELDETLLKSKAA